MKQTIDHYGVSFGMLGILLKYMPISVAYAIWVGAGTLLTAVVGVVVFGEVFTLLKIVGIVTIIAGIVVLNLNEEEQQPSN